MESIQLHTKKKLVKGKRNMTAYILLLITLNNELGYITIVCVFFPQVTEFAELKGNNNRPL